MINVSTQLKKESLTNRNYYVTANVTLSDGTTLKLGKKDFFLSGNSLVDSADSGDFPVGVAIEKTASLSLVNDDGRFDNYNFNGARFVIYLNLQLSDKLETIKKGTYIVSKKPATASEISLSLLDKMHNTDKTYDSNLSFPCTVKELLSECCQQCEIVLGDATFPNADFQIQQAPSNTTYRTIIGMCAGIAGGNARISENDLLRIITFDKNFVSASAGTLSTTDYHTLSSIQNLQYDVDDIIVTGVKYVEDKTEYMSGQDGYVITIDNQLLSGNAQAGVEAIGNQLIGLRMRPFSCEGIANGYATFGDPVEFTDVKKHNFKSFVTDLEFTFGGSTSWSCNAKSAEEDVSEFIGGQQAAVEQSKKDVEKKLSAYDVKLKQMNELAANTLGFYYTEEIQTDGSTISYRHDKPTLADSKVIYKTGVDGFFLSVDGGQTWKAGFDSNGDAVLNILYAIGIQSEWINTRGFTAKDNNGDVTLRVDADTGRVDIVANSFQLKGKTIQEIAKESAKSYVDSVVIDGIDVSTQYFYAYDPTLENAPASEWTDTDTKDKHLNDIFYNTSTKKMFRFIKIDGVYSWESFDDPDIKAALDAASTAQDTADGKRRVFLVTPKPPYDEGDMWVTSTTDGKGEIKICKTPRQSGAFSSADWISPSYVDSDDVNNAISGYDTSLGQPEIFNKLTNNGKNKGIYIQDGELYVNASYILSGVLAGKLINGKGLNVIDKDGQVTLKIDDDGNVYIKATEFSLEGKNISDVVASESEKFRTLNVILSNEYQGIPTDKDGGYTSFPSCSTTVKVLYGSEDVTKTSIIQWTPSSGVYGNASGETYTVTGLSTDTGTVKVTVTRGSLKTEKIFKVAKQKQGKDGINGTDGKDGISPTVSISKSGTTTTITITDKNGTHTQTVKDGTDGTPGIPGADGKTPYFHVKYSNDGGNTFTSNSGETVGSYIGTRTDYNPTDPMYVSAYTWAKIKGDDGKDGTDGTDGKDGATGNGISSVTTYYLATSASSYVYTYTSGWTTSIQTPTADKPYLWSYQTTYYTDGTSDSTSPHIIGIRGKDGEDGKDGKDAGDLTQEQIFNILTNNGQTQGIYLQNGKVYINASYIDTGVLAGWEVGYKKLTADGTYGKVILNASTGEIYSETNSGVYVPGYGTLYGTRIRGIHLYTGTVHASSVSVNTSVSADSVSASKKLTAGTHVEASGHFYSVGTGTDLADASIRGKLKVSGTKSRSVSTADYDEQLFYCYEMPTPFFGDIGESIISDDGTCMIDIDDIFQESANVGIKYYVFLQKEGEGDCWVAEKKQNCFTVKGTPGLKFSFEIKARQTEYEHMRFTDPGDTAYTDARDIEIPEPDYESEGAGISEPDYESELINDRSSVINQMEVIS